MMLNANIPVKRKSINDKDIIDFLTMLEDKFENNTQILQNFYEIFNKYNNSSEEEILIKLREILAEHPVLILELNKMLPKSNRMPLVDQERADNFLMKIKNKDDNVFREIMKSLFSFKTNEITLEKLITNFEENLMKYPDLLEEAYFFLDYRRINNSEYKKKIGQKLSQQKLEPRARMSTDMKAPFVKYRDTCNITPTKTQKNPEYLFFESLKNIFDSVTYKILIKLLHLFNEGILNHSEYVELSEPYFENHMDLFDYLRTITYSKMMNRRQYAIINKPLSELDLTKSQRLGTSYSELPKGYPNLICSGRSQEHRKLLNDRFISIPAGSEDDKNPLKKNHYEEHIFKFEDQRYEIDMIIEILKSAIEKLEILNEKVQSGGMNTVELKEELSTSTISCISMFYKEYGTRILQGINSHPRDTIPIVINRFKKRIEEAQSQKMDLEKNIKLSFDRFYLKSFDYRSFKFKNFERKNNNAKAFIKEINNRKKNKTNSHNINILKGGMENFEFYFSMNFKYAKENIMKITKNLDDEILIKYLNPLDVYDAQIKKKFPEIRIMLENEEVLKMAVSLIYYQIYSSNVSESGKILSSLNFFLENIFCLNVTSLISLLFSENSPVLTDKDLSYIEIIESIKTKSVDEKEIEKFFKIDILSKYVQNTQQIDNINSLLMNSPVNINKDSNDNQSEISLTPSLQSQDTGKTFKDIIIRDETNDSKLINDPTLSTSLENIFNNIFIPRKTKNDILFFSNENCFVLIRFIFCIYERVNKLYEYSVSSNPITSSKDDLYIFKNFIVIYKALIHKKIENTNTYEELCRDILGNDSYFLFNLDKIINSLIKTINSINNDVLSKDVIELFVKEKSRKHTVSENIYLTNFYNLSDSSNHLHHANSAASSSYRILFAPRLRIMTIHQFDLSTGGNSNRDSENFRDFVDNVLHESYLKLKEENQNFDEPFNIYLEKNKKLVKRKRNCSRPDININNLLHKFDYMTKNILFVKSGSDVLFFEKQIISPKEKLKIIFKKNLKFRKWNEFKIQNKK